MPPFALLMSLPVATVITSSFTSDTVYLILGIPRVALDALLRRREVGYDSKTLYPIHELSTLNWGADNF